MVEKETDELELVFDEDELPCSMRVLPLPRKWELTAQERKELHEAWLLVQAEELRPFLDIRGIRAAYNTYLKYGNWVQHVSVRDDAAGSAPFDTYDFDRHMSRSAPMEE